MTVKKAEAVTNAKLVDRPRGRVRFARYEDMVSKTISGVEYVGCGLRYDCYDHNTIHEYGVSMTGHMKIFERPNTEVMDILANEYTSSQAIEGLGSYALIVNDMLTRLPTDERVDNHVAMLLLADGHLSRALGKDYYEKKRYTPHIDTKFRGRAFMNAWRGPGFIFNNRMISMREIERVHNRYFRPAECKYVDHHTIIVEDDVLMTNANNEGINNEKKQIK